MLWVRQIKQFLDPPPPILSILYITRGNFLIYDLLHSAYCSVVSARSEILVYKHSCSQLFLLAVYFAEIILGFFQNNKTVFYRLHEIYSIKHLYFDRSNQVINTTLILCKDDFQFSRFPCFLGHPVQYSWRLAVVMKQVLQGVPIDIKIESVPPNKYEN